MLTWNSDINLEDDASSQKTGLSLPEKVLTTLCLNKHFRAFEPPWTPDIFNTIQTLSQLVTQFLEVYDIYFYANKVV